MLRLAAVIVSCPECNARYKLADDAIPAIGRRMRCAQCSHAWLAMPVDEPPAPPTPSPLTPPPLPSAPPVVERPDGTLAGDGPAPPPALPDPVAAATEPNAPQPHVVLKTLVAIVLGLVLTCAAIAIQLGQIPAGLPQLPWFERPLPAPPRPVPLSLTFSHADRALPSGRRLVELTGEVANPTAVPQRVPAIEASLAGPPGTRPYRWTIAPPVATLPPGRAVAFGSTAFDPPAAARTLDVRFTR